MENQTTIFDMLYPKYKITKPIRLIEFFGGYGSQALALKYLGVEFEHWKLVEWAVKSIKAYKDIHFTNESAVLVGYNREREIQYLHKKGISNNYNEPMTLEQIKRLNDNQIYAITENILLTHNLVNIQQVKGEDLEIVDTDKYDYILTYSFPCQDLSLAGKGKGMSDTSTRSGLLWEVERILTECKELGELPQILLMENVPQVHSEDNLEDFNKWKYRLEELGYKNYFQDLIATDYGIPQTRNRTFMISLLGDYSYTFPTSIPLKLKLKDLLQEQVDEKYYLNEKGMQYICGNAINSQLKDMYDRNNALLNRSNAYCLNTKVDRRAGDSNYILEGYGETSIKDYLKIKEEFKINPNRHSSLANSVLNSNYLCPTLDTMSGGNRQPKILIKNATSKGYLENGLAPTLTATSADEKIMNSDLRIRKLTPRECFRLMGVKDEDYEKCAKNQSDSSLYHLAGDSIVVNVLMAIFKELI